MYFLTFQFVNRLPVILSHIRNLDNCLTKKADYIMGICEHDIIYHFLFPGSLKTLNMCTHNNFNYKSL